MRKYLTLALIQVLVLAGCGGGGGGYGGSSSGGSSSGSSSGGQVIVPPGTPNVEPIIVDQGPAALAQANPPMQSVDTAFVTLHVCIPGTNTCQDVDHIQVDTGSAGLRIMASVLTITLPAELDASNHPMAECFAFASSSSWGSLAVADIVLPVSTESAAKVNLQVIGDPNYESNRPANCNGTNSTIEDTVVAFGANGIIGVGPFRNDCEDQSGNNFCAANVPTPGQYFGCPTPATCVAETASDAAVVVNPVTLLAKDNNGVIIELPSVATAGATTVNGSLVFGIGTESNNALATGVSVLTATLSNGDTITATYANINGGASMPDSYLDSGSNGNLFADSSVTQCGASEMNFYCPGATMTLPFNGMVTGANSVTAAANFSVADAATLFGDNPSYTAFSNIGGVNGDSLSMDLGLPFFLGRNVYTAIEGATAGTSMGPFYAF